MNEKKSSRKIFKELQERAKELNCLYRVEEILSNHPSAIEDLFRQLVKLIPMGWQYPDLCMVKVIYGNKIYTSDNYFQRVPQQCADICTPQKTVGKICIAYIKDLPEEDNGPFLKEEQRLVQAIADRVGHTLFYLEHKTVMEKLENAQENLTKKTKSKGEWNVVVDLLRQTDQNLYRQISRKMMNYLCWSGFEEAIDLMRKIASEEIISNEEAFGELNQPSKRHSIDHIFEISNEIFEIASKFVGSRDILSLIHKWIHEDKSSYLVKTLENHSTPLLDIEDTIRRYSDLLPDLSPNVKMGLRVSLIRRFFFERLEFINIAKHYMEVMDFKDLMRQIIFPTGSLGKLGGKGAGLFLAHKILQRSPENKALLEKIKVPKTWYVTSDGVLNFIHYNNLEDVIEQKYKEIDQIRMEYPQIIQLFKNSYFPPEIIKGLSMALDDFGENPLIVRSSSLLEDSLGTAFSGKYKSLFLANQGTKQQRLEALMDAIAEVYASTFSMDPIQYRSERGLLDFHEEMGILIQEVVGKKVGHYFLPCFAGVAFSNNEFRWSPRIRREDGLIRLVPGLGTRAVDRVSNDYPILLAPGQPNLRVNVTTEEIVRYSPHFVDVINLETNSFETLEILELLKKHGDEYPNLRRAISIYKENSIRRPSPLMDYEPEDIVFSFEGLIKETPFMKQMHCVLQTLEKVLQTPVDIEFASDGDDFYLLQCRPQSFSQGNVACPIPQDIPESQILFTANKYVSNGRLPEITHLVYVDPESYYNLSDLAELTNVGRVIGKINKLLPKKQFILMGPGRWGSRGDIKLGVKVTYSDFSNTSMLVEIARQKGNYLPELSFGTHFFQDLVESNIRYLPLYPDDPQNKFNNKFFLNAENILPQILPEAADLASTIRIIDIPKSTGGKILRILMNADLDQALGYISEPLRQQSEERSNLFVQPAETNSDDHWRWRLLMAEKIARILDPEYFGIKNIYVFGSTKNATAGPGSDIDLLLHVETPRKHRRELVSWLEGWSGALSEMNYLKTGYKSEGLLDFHFVTDQDIANKTSYAVKIDAITDAAKPLPMRTVKNDTF